MCTAAYPNLTAMGRNAVDTGKTAARLMLRLIDGEKVGHIMEEPYERACARIHWSRLPLGDERVVIAR